MTAPDFQNDLDAIVAASPVAIVGLDDENKIDLWSSSATALFGWTRDEAVSGAIDPVIAMAPFLHLASGTLRTRLPKKDGGTVEVECRAARRGPAGWILFATDLTQLIEREQQAEARVKAESRFRELLEAAPDAIIEVDREGRIVLLNAVTEKLFGYSRAELLGRSVDELIPVGVRKRHAEHRADYWSNPQTRPMGLGLTLQARRKDGSEFPVEISLSPVRSDEGFRVTAIIRDVTQQKVAEEKIRFANQQLEMRNREIERADRLKSEFLASMSHELRTPLHTIIGFTELLAEELEGPLNDKQKRFVQHVHQDSLHLLDLINDILDLSKIEAGRMELRPETFDARQALVEAIAGIRPVADAKKIVVDNRIADAVPVLADRVRFREIATNLLSNAVKFTPEGGRVWIEQCVDGDMSCFSICDTGVGIAPEDHLAIFDKFRQVGSTTRGVREGTGLGLAIVKRLVEMQGGSIRVVSALGQGSQFTFTMPSGFRKPNPPLVLIIEDEPSGRELLSNYLHPHGVRTEWASTGLEGIEKARQLRPDAITLDLLMPGRTGWQTLRELRRSPETCDVPVFVISVLDEDKVALEMGAAGYLRKPLKRESLLRALREHIPARFGTI
ncbi:MAG TPA: PAS domain S-box protein [Bryobacteraceae bacterium]|nr:PAS domain S-box protein [Bryobacteraceae bacterium]